MKIKQEIINLVKDTFTSRESLLLWLSPLVILFLLYRSDPYWHPLVLNYLFSSFLFVFIPVAIYIFPQKEKQSKSTWILWFTFFILSILPMLLGEFFSIKRDQWFPPYVPGQEPMHNWPWLPVIIIPLGILMFWTMHKSGFKPADFGISWGRWKLWVPLVVAFLIIITPILWILSKQPEFQQTYPLFRYMIRNNADFWAIDLSWFYYILIWEFLFRGFILFTLAKKIGVSRAIFVQAIIFSFAHLGKPELETYSSLAGGVLVGMLAYLSRSFLPGAVVHWALALIMDILVFFS
ncbi:MAG: hypothetical protein APR63_08565 [Desulfuromonas sp. SDB]|nr:MAG: hypothetical protein APR63_08565 [Desulfuromonas sp. SDB]